MKRANYEGASPSTPHKEAKKEGAQTRSTQEDTSVDVEIVGQLSPTNALIAAEELHNDNESDLEDETIIPYDEENSTFRNLCLHAISRTSENIFMIHAFVDQKLNESYLKDHFELNDKSQSILFKLMKHNHQRKSNDDIVKMHSGSHSKDIVLIHYSLLSLEEEALDLLRRISYDKEKADPLEDSRADVSNFPFIECKKIVQYCPAYQTNEKVSRLIRIVESLHDVVSRCVITSSGGLTSSTISTASLLGFMNGEDFGSESSIQHSLKVSDQTVDKDFASKAAYPASI